MSVEQKQRAIDIHHEQADLFKQRYEQFERDPYSSAFTYGRRKTDAILERYLPAQGHGRRLLDAGCGSGYALHHYSQHGYACAGLDAAPGMVEHARELNPTLDIRSGDVERLPFDDSSFDYVISIEVIRYLAEPQKALQEFHRVLRPGGIALVTAMPPLTLTGYPIINQITSRVQLGGLSKVRQYFHSVSRLNSMFRSSGFSDVEITAAFWGPFRAIERIAPRLLPSALRAWEPMDNRLMRVKAVRDFSNHIVVAATK